MVPKILIALSTLMVLIGCGGSSEKASPPPTSTQPAPAPAPSPAPVPSAGQQFYVSASGLDSNPGSQSAPWATIQHAAIVVAPGDTVHVAPGTYSPAVKTATSGTSSARIRFVSDVQWGAHINTVGATSSWENDGDYVDILGFSVSGDGDIGILNQGSNVRIIGNEVHDVLVTDCTDNGGAGIDNANYSAQNDDTIANYVHDIGNLARVCPRVQGIYHSNLGGHIWNNISIRNEAWGIQLWHAANAAVIANNLSSQNGEGGITVGAGDAPGGVTANNMVVTNNVLVYNGSGTSGAGILEAGATGPNNLYSNNVVFGNPTAVSLLTGTASNTIVADPNLLNAPNPQSLCNSSFILKAGTATGAPPNDANGAPRPNPPDIGPYQCGAADPAWPWM
jgi:hypothetical protein